MELNMTSFLLFLGTLTTFLPFLFIIFIMIMLMYHAHTSSNERFNIYETLIDNETGKASIERIGMWLAMLASTWWFFDQVASKSAGWEEMVAYTGVLGLTKVASSFVNAKYPSTKTPTKAPSKAPSKETDAD